MWTRHGNQIPGTTVGPSEHRPAVVNCGSFHLCRECRIDLASSITKNVQDENNRASIVRRAQGELNWKLLDTQKEFDLTQLELLHILCNIQAEGLEYLTREESHEDSEPEMTDEQRLRWENTPEPRKANPVTRFEKEFGDTGRPLHELANEILIDPYKAPEVHKMAAEYLTSIGKR